MSTEKRPDGITETVNVDETSSSQSSIPQKPSIASPGVKPDDVSEIDSIAQEKKDANKSFPPTKSAKRVSFFQSLMKGKQPTTSVEYTMLSTPATAGTSVSAVKSSNASPTTATEIEATRGHRATVKTLEERYNRKGYQVLQEPGFFSFTSTDMYKKTTTAKPVEEKWAQYALCVVRHFNQSNVYQSSTLEIKSEYIKRSLQNIIKYYPGVSFRTQTVKLQYPLKCLYHYMDGIVKEMENKTGEWREHMELLVNFLRDSFKEIVRESQSLLPENLITSDILWTIFKPGEIFLTSIHGQLRALRLIEFSDNFMTNSLIGSFIDYDGKKFYKNIINVYIRKFTGVEKITNLQAYPLKFHPKSEEIRSRLLARGRKFEALQGRHYSEYDGVGIIPANPTIRGNATLDFVLMPTKYNIAGRIMVDAESYFRLNPDRVVKPVDHQASTNKNNQEDEYTRTQMEMERRQRVSNGQLEENEDIDNEIDDDDQAKNGMKTLTEDQCIICTSTVPGFAFGEKQWVEFYIDQLSDVKWNKDAFASLVLDPDQKALIRALVESHTKEQELTTTHRLKNATKITKDTGEEVIIFDDFVRGKGRGLISILHGPPGVGKTLTAESVAEFVQRPLYSVSSGELGTTPAEVEKSLSTILDVAKVWNAVLLLDEADVFLEQRSSKDVVRNALVSVFLRMLEYYQGILFLTSNRVGTFDEAFQSRMHVAIRYPLLDKAARREVWVNFMKMVDGGNCIELSTEDLDQLAEIELNGRQIKNAVKTGKSLADSEFEAGGKNAGKVKVTKRHLLVVLRLMKEFEEDFLKGGREVAGGRKRVDA